MFGCYVLKETNNAQDTISGIIINEELCSQLELTTNDKLAAIAHEIGHIIYFFLENKPIDEELKADEFACKIGLSRELLGLLGKMKKANIIDVCTLIENFFSVLQTEYTLELYFSSKILNSTRPV